MDSSESGDAHLGLLRAVVQSGLASSNSAARKLVQTKGISINGVAQDDSERDLDWSDALYGRFYLMRRGKKKWHLLVRKMGPA